MNGGVITGCTATNYGGGVYNDIGASFTTTGGEISGNKAGLGGGVFNTGDASFTMTGGEISGNTATNGLGGGVYNGGTFTFENGKISGNTVTGGDYSNDGGGVYSGSGASFIMTGGEISGNTAYDGGGVHNFGTFTFENGKIFGNTAYDGGGGVFSYGNLSIIGGKISGNTAYNGGGVYSSGTFTFENGEISGNTAAYFGGGVFNMSSIPFKMSGGEISGNTSAYGGGVYNFALTFTFENGKIFGNTATGNGGGVYNYTYATLTMSGDAVISNNTANLGGGIYTTNVLNIAGGTISGNAAKGADANGSGGGIYTTNFANVTVGDGVVFTGNTAPTLRTKDIAASADLDKNGTADLTDYVKIGAVELDALVLNALVGPEKNAPAYNNYDINYLAPFVVFINIDPNGSGTVTVTNSTDSTNDATFTENGYVYVLPSANTITLSASPAEGYEFKQFSMGGVTDPADVKVVNISGNATITVEFSLIVIPPHIITATADEGSTISPDGAAEVPKGEDQTFEFSAKPGYKITAVIVNGVPISPEELAAGEYTFTDVDGDRTIEIVSEAVVEVGSGSDGTGAGGSGGTGTGNGGDSTSNGSSGGTGAGVNDGSETGTSPSITKDGEWSVLSMIFAVIAVFAGVIALVAGRDRFRTDDEERRSKTGITLRVLALIIGIVSVIVLFVTEYGSMAPVAVGTWTPLMFVLLLATLVLAMISFRFDKADS